MAVFALLTTLFMGYLYSAEIGNISKTLFIRKKELASLDDFFRKRFHYYLYLNQKEQRRFLVRVALLRERKQLKISPEIVTPQSEVELMICAAFAQITFGYNRYELEKFTRVIMHPDTFYSRLVDNDVKGLTLGNGYIFYSWEDFIDGYIFEKDKLNLALHELAHALYIDRFREEVNEDWDAWEERAALELDRLRDNPQLDFFRPYGKSNAHEFWAVCVECFFEDPLGFKSNYGELYQLTAAVLKQDMATRLALASV